MSRRLLGPQLWLHRADVQLLLACKEEDPPEKQEWSPSLDQEDPQELPDIKEEQEELWTSQEGEQLQELEDDDIIKFTFTPVPVKSEENDEEKSQSSQVHQGQTEQMKKEPDGEDCGIPEPARNVIPDRHLQPDCHYKILDFSEPDTDDSDDWKKTSEPQSGLNFVKNKSGCNTGEKSFSCPECSKQFSQNSNLRTHMRTHTGEKPFSCSVCSKKFKQKIHLTRHMALHTGEKPFCCSVCSKSFIRPYQLKKHHCVGHQSSQLHQGGEDCGGSEPASNFNSDSHLQPATHNETSQLSEPKTDDNRCRWDETREPQSGLNPLQNNEVPVSDMECNTGKMSISSSECATSFGHKGHDGIQTGVKSFSCSVCGKTYPRRNSLATHMKLHTEGKCFSCSVCKKKFQRREYVVKHMRSHTGEKPYMCPVCGLRLAQSSTLISHLRVHTGEKPYTCSVCKKTFHQSGEVVRHMRIHTGEKPFSCPVCGIRLTQSSNLTSHLKVHTGEKPFTCSVCKANFSRRSNLSRHMRMHTGEKPYSCSVCGKRFGEKGNLRQHLILHTGEKPFSCSLCGKRFADRGNLRQHLTVHTGEKQFSCSVCDERFTQLAHMKNHNCADESSGSSGIKCRDAH